MIREGQQLTAGGHITDDFRTRTVTRDKTSAVRRKGHFNNVGDVPAENTTGMITQVEDPHVMPKTCSDGMNIGMPITWLFMVIAPAPMVSSERAESAATGGVGCGTSPH